MEPDINKLNLSELDKLKNKAAKTLWHSIYGHDTLDGPPCKLTRNILAWDLQAAQQGGLDRTTMRQIKHLARCFDANPNYRLEDTPIYAPGTQYVRDWKGKRYTVVQRLNGVEYSGTLYRSLSEVARLITGTRWSGPAFFGLKRAR
ncbi:DUF2924 domain-containing protein [Kordiimonas aquimaris]|uniref:DUF2924 domain-containing protein n=1 Tax=Kordiimonas aquimaris TaxID=707591 RepID=UPI0021D34B38|nr:DUF2924 domain-containing protein [Kordiimonas aquimaris]